MGKRIITDIAKGFTLMKTGHTSLQVESFSYNVTTQTLRRSPVLHTPIRGGLWGNGDFQKEELRGLSVSLYAQHHCSYSWARYYYS